MVTPGSRLFEAIYTEAFAHAIREEGEPRLSRTSARWLQVRDGPALAGHRELDQALDLALELDDERDERKQLARAAPGNHEREATRARKSAARSAGPEGYAIEREEVHPIRLPELYETAGSPESAGPSPERPATTPRANLGSNVPKAVEVPHLQDFRA